MLRVMRAYENIAEEERGNGVYMTRYAEMIRGMFEATEKERLESYDTSITGRTDIERLESRKNEKKRDHTGDCGYKKL